MKTSEMDALIRERAQNRFDVSVDESLTTIAKQLQLDDVIALRIRRTESQESNGRTVLLAVIDKIDDWRTVVRWTAQVRDELPEPETADLYLIMLAEGFSPHNRSRIEADEQFCRKYVTSSLDELPLLLDRTFLASLSTSYSGSGIADPVTAAFLEIQTKYSWLTDTLQDKWLNTFLSEKPGKDLVSDIIESVGPEMDI